jgi:hypothetical protein
VTNPSREAVTGWQKDGSYIPCPECRWEPEKPRRPMIGTPLGRFGTIHYGDCSTVPRLSREAEKELRETLDDIDRCQRDAWANARNYVID